MTTELIDSRAGLTSDVAVDDVADDLHLYASNRGEMAVAQAQLAEWFTAKLEIVKRDHDEMRDCVFKAKEAGNFDTRSLERQEKRLRERVAYYAKLKAAADAGYAIVPNMPATILAVRTNKSSPRSSTSPWSENNLADHRSEAPPIGEGDWVNPAPDWGTRRIRDGEQPDGSPRFKTEWYSTGFLEPEFPVAIAKPQIVDKSNKAFAEKIFDELHVVGWEPRRKADPLLLGVIFTNGRQRDHQHVTFLISWNIDTRTIPE